MNHSTQQIVIAKLLSTKMHCVTHSLFLSYHYKPWEHLMNNREARMNSSMLYSLTIFSKYWAKFCLQIHAARIEVCPLYLFLKIKALLLFSLGTSVTQSIVRMWISFLKSFEWSRECLPGTRKDTSGIIATKLRWWNITIPFCPSDFQSHIPHTWLFHNPSCPAVPLGSSHGWHRGWTGEAGGQVHPAPGSCSQLGGGSLELSLGLFLWLVFFFVCFFPELLQGT